LKTPLEAQSPGYVLFVKGEIVLVVITPGDMYD